MIERERSQHAQIDAPYEPATYKEKVGFCIHSLHMCHPPDPQQLCAAGVFRWWNLRLLADLRNAKTFRFHQLLLHPTHQLP